MALQVNELNVKPGGKQPKMRDSIVQPMNFNDGTPKGMKKILEERGVNTKKEDMQAVLRSPS